MKTLALALLTVLLAAAPTCADLNGGIQWYGTWSAALKEAQRTGSPILLVAAAPHCHNVSGVW
jgi:hypothetical protein